MQIVDESSIPIACENVRKLAGIKNWQTCLKHLLELTVAGKIKGMKTSKSWIFWAVEIKEEERLREKK
jgi:hypothetical protein